ncbi:type II toxin-antitoxin system PemK/MazF family toxin [Ruania zhangjianzhongii]|uniref:type II toxin-antitoxin system PemK/MazF family toxin n=1 Tax=Ruania zhangjianzhongii TaxID=2603206 RepID=UPI0011CADEA4
MRSGIAGHCPSGGTRSGLDRFTVCVRRVVDWRGGALPREPSKLRSGIVVEDGELFPDDYPNILVVPMTRDEGLAHESFAERIEPTAQNSAEGTCWALAHHVTSVSLRRVTPTDSRVTDQQLANIRQRIRLTLGD